MQQERESSERDNRTPRGKKGLARFGAQASLKKVASTPILIMLFGVWVLFFFFNSSFFKSNNLITLFVVNAFFGVGVIGETFVLMTGGIDLSIGQNIACSSIVSALCMISYRTSAINSLLNPGGPILSLREIALLPGMTKPMMDGALATTVGATIIIGLFAALGVGLLFGLINGVAVGIFRMTPFIVTLATQLLARGISFVLSNGISIAGTPRELTRLSYAYGIPITHDVVIPWVIIIVLALFLVCGIFLGKTSWGRYITLVGSNPQAAAYVGIRVPFVISSVYVIAGLLAGIGGFISIICFGTADVKVGDPLLLPIIGSVILGGVSTMGGEGSMTKAALGVLLFATIINGMTLKNLSLSLQQIILGLIIIMGMALLARVSSRRT
jgi:ribose/xylose/arabinose/galactoside ABC-type transport system permease subunit